MRDETTKGNTSGTIRALTDLVFHPPKFLLPGAYKVTLLGGTTDREHVFMRRFFLKSSHFLAIKKRERVREREREVGVCRSDDASDSEERFDGRMSRSRVVVLQKKKETRWTCSVLVLEEKFCVLLVTEKGRRLNSIIARAAADDDGKEERIEESTMISSSSSSSSSGAQTEERYHQKLQ